MIYFVLAVYLSLQFSFTSFHIELENIDLHHSLNVDWTSTPALAWSMWQAKQFIEKRSGHACRQIAAGCPPQLFDGQLICPEQEPVATICRKKSFEGLAF